MNQTLRKKNMADAELLIWLEQQARKNEKGCWNWTKRINRDGYGQVSYKMKTTLVHRLIYSLVHKITLKSEQLILHLCDNPNCFNPNHLKIGSASENMLQSYERNTTRKRRKINTIQPHQYTLEQPKLLQQWIVNNCEIDQNGCWLYPLYKGERYGIITVKGKTYRVHRLMLSIYLDKPYKALQITRHLCHVKNCCNPAHLAEGTNSDNMLDSRKGLLSEEIVEEILQFSASQEGQKLTGYEIDDLFATKFNVSDRTIQSCRIGNSWADVYNRVIVANGLKSKMKKRKLTKENVEEILQFLLSEGMNMYGKDIDALFSQKFGVSTATIVNIRYGYRWSEIYNAIIDDPNKLNKKHFSNKKFRY